MVLPRKDLLWLASIPFRIENRLYISEDEFIFGLSYGQFKDCTFSAAKKILHLALGEGFIIRSNGKLAFKNVNLWIPKKLPIEWSPDFNLLEDDEEEPLTPLPKTKSLFFKSPTWKKPPESHPISVAQPPPTVKPEGMQKKGKKPPKPSKQVKTPKVEKVKPKEKKKKVKKLKSIVPKTEIKKKKKKKMKTLKEFFD